MLYIVYILIYHPLGHVKHKCVSVQYCTSHYVHERGKSHSLPICDMSSDV